MADDSKLELGTQTTTTTVPSAPSAPASDRYAGKSAEDLIKMHREAEAKIGEMGTQLGELRKTIPSANPAAPTSSGDPAALMLGAPAPKPAQPSGAPAVINSATEAITRAGLDEGEVIANYVQTGKLAPQHLEKLAKIGIGESLANTLATGQAQAYRAALIDETKVAESVWGEEGLKTILADASAMITSDSMRERFNRDLNTPGKRLETIKSLNDMRREKLGASGSNPTFRGSAPGTNNGPVSNPADFDKTYEAALKGDPTAIERILKTDTKSMHMDRLNARPQAV